MKYRWHSSQSNMKVMDQYFMSDSHEEFMVLNPTNDFLIRNRIGLDFSKFMKIGIACGIAVSTHFLSVITYIELKDSDYPLRDDGLTNFEREKKEDSVKFFQQKEASGWCSGVGAMGFWMPATRGTAYEMPGDPDSVILFEFRAGKMVVNGLHVVPDRRKGLIRLVQTADTLMHFQWWNRTGPTLVMEDDILFVPEEATFEKVGQSSGRVFVLKFKYDERKFFYWMQEVDKDGDNDIVAYVQQHIDCPTVLPPEQEDSLVPIEVTPDGVIYHSRDRVPEGVPILSSDPLREQLPRDLLPRVAPSTGVVQQADLQRILSGLSHPPEADLAMARDTGPGFSELLKPDVVEPLLENLHLEERLAPYLPELKYYAGVRTKQAIADLMQSPQFHQQLDSFTQVIRSGQIDLSQFGIDSSRYNFTVVSFLEAIEDQAISSALESETDQRSNQDVMEEGR